MDLAAFLDRLEDVTEDGDGWLARCPRHSDSNPSLRIAVTPEGKVLIKDRAACPTPEIMSALGLSMRDLASLRVDDDALVPRAALSQAEPSPEMLDQLRSRLDAYMLALTDRCIEYAGKRFGIDEAECRRLELGTAYDLGGGERLVIPFLDADGTAIGFQARALDSDARVRWIGPANVDGVSWSKVGLLRSVTDWDEVLITEGPGDGLTSVGLGHSAVLLRGAGLAASSDVVAQVADLVGAGTALLAGDGDDAGRIFNENLARGLADQGTAVKILAVPTGLDLTSWRERDGDDDIYLAIQSAERVFDPSDVMLDRDLDRYPLTDLGQARFLRDFILAQGSGVRHADELGFFVLDRGVWAPDSQARVRGYAHGAADRLAELAKVKIAAAGKDQKGEALRWHRAVERYQSTNGLNAAVNELRSLPEVSVPADAFDKHKDLLAVKNGVVDLRTGELRPANPRLLITKRVDVAYRPDAQAPRWSRFLDEIFPTNPDLPAYMQRLVGYGITGRTDEECFAILHGGGGNGKSKFVGALQHVFGSIAQGVPFSTFEQSRGGSIPNDIARLVGARLVFAAEGKASRTMDEALIKWLTGKSLVTARFMRREFFDFLPMFLLFFETNHVPKFEGQDEGLWRRIKMIPFTRHFAPSERDYGLEQKLINEAEGILAWAVAGAVQWYADGLQDPPSITGATSNLRSNSDRFAGFIPGRFEVTRSPADSVTAKDLWTSYTAWAAEENWALNEVGTRKAFLAEVEERGAYRTTDRHKVQIFTGIRRLMPTEGGE